MSAPTISDPSPKAANNGCDAGENGNPVSAKVRWQPQFWANDRHVALCFVSTKELDAAIDWLWAAPEMRDLPRVHVGENTMIVPAQAAELFTKQGFQFAINPVVSAGDLSAEEVNRIRAGK